MAKAALVVFRKNEQGNMFQKKIGFTERTDLVCRNRDMCELERIDT